MDVLDELTDLAGAPPHEVKAVADRAIKEIERLRNELKNPVCDCVYLDDLNKKDDEVERLREALRKIENYAYHLHVASSKKEYVIIQEMVVSALKESE